MKHLDLQLMATAVVGAAISAMTAAPALAHPGDHSQFTSLQAIQHLFADPFHVALTAVGLAAGVSLSVLFANRIRARRIGKNDRSGKGK